jgi:hypothetical protein
MPKARNTATVSRGYGFASSVPEASYDGGLRNVFLRVQIRQMTGWGGGYGESHHAL